MSASLVSQARAEAERAPFLFADLPLDVLERVERQERDGKWTGERLAQLQPRLYAAVVRSLAADLPVESIAYLLGVSENTVRGVREREPRPIEELKKTLVGKMVIAKERLLERVIQEAPTMEGRDAAVAFGIVSDKLALETGAPTARLEITDSRDAEEYRRWMATLVADAVEVTPGTGFDGRAPAQTREGDAAPAGLVALPEGHPPIAGADIVSDVLRRVLSIDTVTDTVTTDETRGSDVGAARGGRGVSPKEGGAVERSVLPPQNFGQRAEPPLPG